MTVRAFDLGGTRLKAAVVTDGRPGTPWTSGVSGLSADAALEAVRAAADAFDAPATPAGLAVPGIVDGGRVTALPGKFPGMPGRDLAAFLRDDLGAPSCVVVNDAVAYAVGECVAGAGRDAVRAVVVTIGTGVGVAVVDRGAPAGSGPYAAGILGGFIPIGAPDHARDTSGASGTIEAVCRAERIVALAGGRYASVPDVFDAAEAGDASAVRALDAYRAGLVRALVALANAHGPEVVVVGGGPSRRPVLLEGVTDAVNACLWPGYEVRVVPAELPDTAALVGLWHLAEARR